MADENFDQLGPLLTAIGEEAASTASSIDGLYIYAEVENYSPYCGIFMDDGSVVRYFDPSRKLSELLTEAWSMERDESKRWLVMEYEIHGTKFHVDFTFPEEIDPESYATTRRRAALKKRYGEKPIIYPPRPERILRSD